ncbi:ADP-ribosylglycohydrolase family protein [Rhizobium leguminosarum]|nr:ADP-ribosylglycohydrolase family protein [Rhizobium leguminosarum]
MKIIDNTTTSRAIGCILGQLAGDALGSLVEFQTPQEIRQKYPRGVREIHDGGAWNTIAGQPTDDLRDGAGFGQIDCRGRSIHSRRCPTGL